MSDTPQGPDWWQASDGRYYPPQGQAPPPTPPYAPYPAPPPKKSGAGKGCLIASLVAGGLVLFVVAIIVVAIAGEDAADDATRRSRPATPTGGAASLSENTANPPQRDVTIATCTVEFQFAKAGGTITNYSSKPSNYSVHVAFIAPSGVRTGEGYAFANELAPGQMATFEAVGSQQTDEQPRCELISVERYSSRG